MSTAQSWEYAAPTRYVRFNAWARDWCRRWFRHVGTVVVQQATGRLLYRLGAEALKKISRGRP